MKKIMFLLITAVLAAGSVFAQSGSRALPDLNVVFGENASGPSYTLKLDNNETAIAIARHVGSTSWALPIVGFEGFENSDVMHYYDIPGRYVIPADPKAVKAEKAGEVYYSKPNRLLLFFHDAEVKGNFTKVGEFEATDEFIEAVEQNPVLDFWGVMMINVER